VNAVSCIAMQSSTRQDVYTLSLVYYAYTLYNADVSLKRPILNRLRAKAISQGQLQIVYTLMWV